MGRRTTLITGLPSSDIDLALEGATDSPKTADIINDLDHRGCEGGRAIVSQNPCRTIMQWGLALLEILVFDPSARTITPRGTRGRNQSTRFHFSSNGHQHIFRDASHRTRLALLRAARDERASTALGGDRAAAGGIT